MPYTNTILSSEHLLREIRLVVTEKREIDYENHLKVSLVSLDIWFLWTIRILSQRTQQKKVL